MQSEKGASGSGGLCKTTKKKNRACRSDRIGEMTILLPDAAAVAAGGRETRGQLGWGYVRILYL